MSWPLRPSYRPSRCSPPRSRSRCTLGRIEACPAGSAWLWIVGAAAVAIVAVILGLLSLGGGGSSTKPQPVRIQAPARGATPAAEARNLSAWLRAHSR